MDGIVIRTQFSNQNWQAPCDHPRPDNLCARCFKSKLDIDPPKTDDTKCSGHCFEQELHSFLEWGAAKNRKFSNKKAKPGMKVFFVFRQQEKGEYTLWGNTTVVNVNIPPTGKKSWAENKGFKKYIRFRPFEPLPRDKWVADLRDIDLVGKRWGQGSYRYILNAKEVELEKRIEGLVPEKLDNSLTGAPTTDKVTLPIVVTSTIYKRLESEANESGRAIDEIVREAIADWLKGRQQ